MTRCLVYHTTRYVRIGIIIKLCMFITVKGERPLNKKLACSVLDLKIINTISEMFTCFTYSIITDLSFLPVNYAWLLFYPENHHSCFSFNMRDFFLNLIVKLFFFFEISYGITFHLGLNFEYVTPISPTFLSFLGFKM